MLPAGNLRGRRPSVVEIFEKIKALENRVDESTPEEVEVLEVQSSVLTSTTSTSGEEANAPKEEFLSIAPANVEADGTKMIRTGSTSPEDSEAEILKTDTTTSTENKHTTAVSPPEVIHIHTTLTLEESEKLREKRKALTANAEKKLAQLAELLPGAHEIDLRREVFLKPLQQENLPDGLADHCSHTLLGVASLYQKLALDPRNRAKLYQQEDRVVESGDYQYMKSDNSSDSSSEESSAAEEEQGLRKIFKMRREEQERQESERTITSSNSMIPAPLEFSPSTAAITTPFYLLGKDKSTRTSGAGDLKNKHIPDLLNTTKNIFEQAEEQLLEEQEGQDTNNKRNKPVNNPFARFFRSGRDLKRNVFLLEKHRQWVEQIGSIAQERLHESFFRGNTSTSKKKENSANTALLNRKKKTDPGCGVSRLVLLHDRLPAHLRGLFDDDNSPSAGDRKRDRTTPALVVENVREMRKLQEYEARLNRSSFLPLGAFADHGFNIEGDKNHAAMAGGNANANANGNKNRKSKDGKMILNGFSTNTLCDVLAPPPSAQFFRHENLPDEVLQGLLGRGGSLRSSSKKKKSRTKNADSRHKARGPNGSSAQYHQKLVELMHKFAYNKNVAMVRTCPDFEGLLFLVEAGFAPTVYRSIWMQSDDRLKKKDLREKRWRREEKELREKNGGEAAGPKNSSLFKRSCRPPIDDGILATTRTGEIIYAPGYVAQQASKHKRLFDVWKDKENYYRPAKELVDDVEVEVQKKSKLVQLSTTLSVLKKMNQQGQQESTKLSDVESKNYPDSSCTSLVTLAQVAHAPPFIPLAAREGPSAAAEKDAVLAQEEAEVETIVQEHTGTTTDVDVPAAQDGVVPRVSTSSSSQAEKKLAIDEQNATEGVGLRPSSNEILTQKVLSSDQELDKDKDEGAAGAGCSPLPNLSAQSSARSRSSSDDDSRAGVTAEKDHESESSERTMPTIISNYTDLAAPSEITTISTTKTAMTSQASLPGYATPPQERGQVPLLSAETTSELLEKNERTHAEVVAQQTTTEQLTVQMSPRLTTPLLEKNATSASSTAHVVEAYRDVEDHDHPCSGEQATRRFISKQQEEPQTARKTKSTAAPPLATSCYTTSAASRTDDFADGGREVVSGRNGGGGLNENYNACNSRLQMFLAQTFQIEDKDGELHEIDRSLTTQMSARLDRHAQEMLNKVLKNREERGRVIWDNKSSPGYNHRESMLARLKLGMIQKLEAAFARVKENEFDSVSPTNVLLPPLEPPARVPCELHELYHIPEELLPIRCFWL
ncbi:unnamed protein product [Amoebophrya sp. A120]|nr:unnamed protein product [Amoebophrya sp. A120]|eukprot:GSA120T00012555001.1